MNTQPEPEAYPHLLTAEQQGEEWNADFGPYDAEPKCTRRKLSPNHGLVDLLVACPYPFEIPPRQKDFTRPINLGAASES